MKRKSIYQLFYQTLNSIEITSNKAITVIGQPSLVGAGPKTLSGGEENPKLSYANTQKPPKPQSKPITLKQVAYLHGEPKIVWEEKEVEQIIINEHLQYAVIGKFSYGWLDIQELRRLIPK